MKLKILQKIVKAKDKPLIAIRYLFSLISFKFKKNFDELVTKEELLKYTKELQEQKVFDYLEKRKVEFYKLVSGKTKTGKSFVFGEIGEEEALAMYSIVRKFKPGKILETGVCNGASTYLLLKALDKNGIGELISIDYPEYSGDAKSEDANEKLSFWDGKGGSVVPEGKEPGWIIPRELSKRWTLHIGKSQELLPGLLEKNGEIDFFIHDSEHSYECMYFEFKFSYKYLCSGGILLSDDYYWNSALIDFAKEKRKKIYRIGAGMAFIKK